jgi:ubiquinone biosynthesis protein
MALTLKTNHVKQYKDVAVLLAKYANADIANSTDLADMFWAGKSPFSLGDLKNVGHGSEARPRELELKDSLEKLGPTFSKLASLLAMRSDLLSPSYRDALSHLEECAPASDWMAVKTSVESEIGTSISKAFKSFDQAPFSISALSQIHRATLRDGRRAVVKIQHPEVRERVHDDLQALEELASFCQEHKILPVRFDFLRSFHELKQIMIAELDLRQEAQNLKTLHEHLKSHDRITVGIPVEKYCTARMLTKSSIEGTPLSTVEHSGLLKAERRKLAEQLLQAYLQQILVNGFVGVDCAPDRTLLTVDGKLALLEFGSVARISPSVQHKLIALLFAVDQTEVERVADLAVDLGAKNEGFNRAELRRAISDMLLVHRDMAEEHMEVGLVLESIARACLTNGLQLPMEVAMLGSVMRNLDSIVKLLDPEFDANDFIRKSMPPIMRKRANEAVSPAQIFRTLVETTEFVEHLPNQFSTILDAVANNELKIQVHAIDEQLLMIGFQKVANRITVGLVLAALIIGASMLMRVQTQFTIVGYPGLAILCFVAAAGTGFGLIVEILLGDRKSRTGRR